MEHGPTDHVDVLIVGAGLSGIGAACHLQEECPDKTYAILESRGAIGGTWDLFRYPGSARTPTCSPSATRSGRGRTRRPSRTVRRSAATSRTPPPSTASGTRSASTTRCSPPSGRRADARWTVTARRSDTGETVAITCSWLSICAGYYRYDEGYRPRFPGEERFAGQRDPSAALARGPRRHRAADRRHRQRRHRRHPRADPGRGRRARHDAAAHAELRPVAARPGPAGRGAAPAAAGDGWRIRSCGGRTSCSPRPSSSSAGAGPRPRAG